MRGSPWTNAFTWSAFSIEKGFILMALASKQYSLMHCFPNLSPLKNHFGLLKLQITRLLSWRNWFNRQSILWKLEFLHIVPDSSHDQTNMAVNGSKNSVALRETLYQFSKISGWKLRKYFPTHSVRLVFPNTKTKQRHYKKRKLLINISHEYKWKNP